MSRLEASLRLLIELIDTALFFFLAVKGFLFILDARGGYVPFWGCALIVTAVLWKRFDKGEIVSSMKRALTDLFRA